MSCPNDGRPSRNGRDTGPCAYCYRQQRQLVLTALRAGQACPQCGSGHRLASGKPACTGHTRRGACKRAPNPGLEVCATHGGENPTAREVGLQRESERKAAHLMLTYGERVDVDPGEELLDLICWTAGHVRWLRARVQDIQGEVSTVLHTEDDDEPVAATRDGLVWGVTKNKVGGDDGGTTYEAKPNIYLALYNSETDRLAKLCTDAIKIGLKEREVRLAERQGDLLMRVLDGVLGELGHNPSDPKIAGTVERHLRAAS